MAGRARPLSLALVEWCWGPVQATGPSSHKQHEEDRQTTFPGLHPEELTWFKLKSPTVSNWKENQSGPNHHNFGFQYVLILQGVMCFHRRPIVRCSWGWSMQLKVNVWTLWILIYSDHFSRTKTVMSWNPSHIHPSFIFPKTVPRKSHTFTAKFSKQRSL